jgi:hypothetical protein
MSFRQNSETNREWQTWLNAHQKTLLDCGVPLLVLEDRKSWFYFLEHGYFRPVGTTESIIDVDRMPHDEAEKLCVFLEGANSPYPNSSTLNRLQFLFGRGPHAKTNE